MAQPKPKAKRGGFDKKEEDVEAKALKEKRSDAEVRLRKIVERRNALNDEARQAREARDALNAERQKIYAEVEGLIAQRGGIAGHIKQHKQVRGEAQARARALIGLKQEKRKGASGSAGLRTRDLEAAVKALEFKQQTVPMGAKDELELVDDIKKKAKELEDLRKLKVQEDLLFGEVKDLDAAINEAFAKADAAHAEVVRLSNEWQALTDRLEPAFKNLGVLKGEADKKHAEFVDLRQRADAEHQKANELRGEVEQAHGEVQKLYDERRTIVREMKQQVREALDDPAKLEASNEEALRLLREKGRISL